MGCRLFRREHRGVSLTPEGRHFYEGMAKICQEYQDLRDSLRLKRRKGLYLGIAMQEYIKSWLHTLCWKKPFPIVSSISSFRDM